MNHLQHGVPLDLSKWKNIRQACLRNPIVGSLVKAWECPLATEVKRFGTETALSQPLNMHLNRHVDLNRQGLLERHGEEVVCGGRLFSGESRRTFRKRATQIAGLQRLWSRSGEVALLKPGLRGCAFLRSWQGDFCRCSLFGTRSRGWMILGECGLRIW